MMHDGKIEANALSKYVTQQSAILQQVCCAPVARVSFHPDLAKHPILKTDKIVASSSLAVNVKQIVTIVEMRWQMVEVSKACDLG
eukprot:690586-Amphidinium_carterae.1